MKRCLAFFIFFLVAWQQSVSQGVVEHGLNGDIRSVQSHQSTVFENSPKHENASFKTIKDETIPDKSLPHAGDLHQLSKPVEDIAEIIHSRDNGPTISPKEASTTSRASDISPESTMQLIDDGQTVSPRGTSISPPHLTRKSTLPILLADSEQNMSPAETSTRLPSIVDEITPQSLDNGHTAVTEETSTTLANIEDGSTHLNQLVDTGQDISPKETSTRPPSIADKISMQPIDSGQGSSSKEKSTKESLAHAARASLAKTPQQKLPTVENEHDIQPVGNSIQNRNPGTSAMPQAEAGHLQMNAESTEMPLVAQPTQHILLDDGDTKGTSAPVPALTHRVTPAPIFMLNAGQLTKPNTEIQSTIKIMQGEFATSVSQATPHIEQEVSTDSENNDPDFTPHSGTEFTTPIPNREQELSSDNEKKERLFIPHNAGESTHPLLKLQQEIKIPPTPVPGLYSDLKTRQFKVRRKKRSTNDEYPERRQTECQEKVSMFPKSYIWGVIGWACVLVLLWLYLNEKLSIWATIVQLVTRRRDPNPQDIESGPQPNPEDNEEIQIHEKKGRSPSGYGIVKINEGYIELIDESYLTQGVFNLPRLAQSLPNAENPEMALGKMEAFHRRASEKVKVIRRLSSGCSSLGDQILLAKEVISDHVGDDDKVSEKRKVIREVTANERKGSLRDEIEFARSVILPSDVIKEQDEEAMHRRQQIKAQTSGRRTSLLEEINVAKEVLGVVDDVAP